MELRLGLHAPSTGARADVLVRARDGACLAEVQAELLARVCPAGVAGRLSVGGVAVPGQTLLGAPPLVQGAVLQVDATLSGQLPDGRQVRVVGGPSSGLTRPLGVGVILGRGEECDLRLDDPLVSRRHCRIELGTAVTVHDLASANGVTVDGVPVGVEGALLPVGAVLQVGSSRLAVGSPAPSLPVRPTGDGWLAVNRPPRPEPDRLLVQVVVPPEPLGSERRTVPVLAVLAPVALGLVMWRATGSTTFLLLTLLSPVLVVGAFWTERRTGLRRDRRERRRWQIERRACERVLADAVRVDELARRRDHPDLAEVLATAAGPGPRLWEGAGLALRLGLADQPAQVDVRGDTAGLRTTARDVPAVVHLDAVGVLGVAGPRARALARAMLVQAAVRTGPGTLMVVVLAGPTAADSWAWTRWLPHLAPADGQDCSVLMGLDRAQIAARVAELTSRPDGGQPVLLVVDQARDLREVAGLTAILTDGPAHGIYSLCVESDPLLLPVECRGTAVLDAAAQVELCIAGRTPLSASADLLDPVQAEGAARALAALRDDTPDRDATRALPTSVRWTEVAGLTLGGLDDAVGVLQAWAATGRSTAAVLGRAMEGPLVVDLARDGPHALVAGTTGSGKSELLQTLIASLALANRPDELTFVLVDYKGGAAFGPCEHLPHVVGMVTDLDGALVERALASLTAELSRREAVLKAAGAKDIEEHRRVVGPGQVMPRLVLVVDEFASLAEELPDFVGGLVGIAMRGRSLGVHLVLATQRPEGVVSADIRANTNLRLCLAVTRDNESRDVLDSPVAATISRATPGRGWVRTGHTDLTAFQAARVGGRRPARGPTGPRVTLLPVGELGDPCARGSGEKEQDETSDLALLIAACREAAIRLALPPSRSPWLAPLPTVLEAADLPSAGLTLAYGLVDVPTQQARRPLTLDLETSTHLLVLGAARSGRTTVLRGIAGALSRQVCADDVHLYAVDAGAGGLGALAALPHTGAVVGLDEPARLERLLAWLVEQTAERQALLASAGYASLTEQRADSTEPLPHLLLLIDRWEALVAAFQDVDAGHVLDQVHRLLREGPAAGLHVLLTADRSGLVGRTTSLIEQRLVLRMADPGDYAAAGLPTRLVTGSLPPGRGWLCGGEPLVAQVALLPGDPSGAGQAAALGALAAGVSAPSLAPHRFEPLPATVALAALPGPGVVLGVGGDELDPVVLTYPDLENGFLIGGPAGSGRSTALLTVAAGLGDLPVVAVAPRPSPLRALPGCLTGNDVAALRAQLGDGRIVLLPDDAELLVDGPLGPLLEDVVRHARDRGTVVVAAGRTTALAAGFRGAVV
ncbi:MAG: FHA domain-containing protein, partial [Frankiales bacterium]|nr:FHA domain-containing protein [Frankiales bacterium]